MRTDTFTFWFALGCILCLLFSSKVRSYIGFIIVRIRFWTEGGGLAYVTEESNATELCSNDKSSEIKKKNLG